MKVIAYTEHGHPFTAEVEEQLEPGHIIDSSNGTLECKLYRYIIDGSFLNPDNEDMKPFFGFLNGDFCLFSNNSATVKTHELDSYSRMLYTHYTGQLRSASYGNGYSVDSIILDDLLLNVKWNISKKNSYKIQKTDGKFDNLIINYNGELTKNEMIIDILKQLREDKIKGWVRELIAEMGVQDRITDFYIEDPDESNWTTVGNIDQPKSMGVFGTSYKTTRTLPYSPGNLWSKDVSVLYLSPIIYLYNEEEARKLIIHELAHIRIGVDHGHDGYFWWTFEKFAKCPRTFDDSYSKSQETEDTQNYNAANRYRGLTVEGMIKDAEDKWEHSQRMIV